MASDAFRDQLEAYVLGLLGDADARRVREHLETCADCRQEADSLENAARLIERGYDQAPPAYLRAKVLANLKDRRAPRPSWLGWTVPGLVAAAVVVLVIRVDPGRLAKERAAAPSAPAESAESRESAAGPADDQRPAASAEPRKAAEKKRPASEPFAAAAPAGRARDDRETPAADAKMKSARRLELTDAEETEDLAAAADEVLPVAKRAVSESPAGGAGTRSAAAPAAFGGLAAHGAERSLARAPLAQEAQSPAPIRASVCVVKLDEVASGTAPAGSGPVLDAFAARVRPSVLAHHQFGTFRLRMQLDAQGRVSTAAWVGNAFASAELDAFVLAQARALRFTPASDAPPAVLVLKIDVE